MAKQPPSIEDSASEPVKYVGKIQTDGRYFDGALPHVIGAHHYQAFRANRNHPSEPGEVGWTYNHQPYLAYWNDRFFFQYLSNVFEEHNPPGRTLIMTSKDGRKWTDPEVVFPIYSLPEIVIKGQIFIPAGTKSVMHQRMGFYIAPNGRLLTFAFYGFAPTTHHSPNTGNGLGRVVREVYKDGSFGPVYFIRYNRHAGFNESNTNYPFYKASTDNGFVEACESILGDKLMSLQWWEEDRGKDGFFAIDPGDLKNAFKFRANMTTSRGPGKAFCFYTRPDGVVVGLWKNQWSGLSPDRGKTWMPLTKNPSLMAIGAKTWGQQTKDGRYALVFNHSPVRGNRFPMALMTGEDGHEFETLFCLQGEVPTKRYEGVHKTWGSQYIRGIMPGNGDPPGNYLWNVYSMNKEDMWITRTRLPVSATVDQYVEDDFEKARTEADLELWSLYMPLWAPISITSSLARQGKQSLELRDADPYDYALAERTFPESQKATIQFDLLAGQIDHGRMEIDLSNKNGVRPIRIILTDAGRVQAINGDRTIDLMSYETNNWLSFKLDVNCSTGKFSVDIDGRPLLENASFAEKTGTIERIAFRTGEYRQMVPPNKQEKDLPNAGERVKEAVFNLDRLLIKPQS